MSSRLEQALFDVGPKIEYPETPTEGLLLPQRSTRAYGLVLAAAVAAAVLVVLALPGPRQAVANLFRIGSVSLTVVDELPAAELVRIPGDQVTLEAAQRRVAFDILSLGGDPDAVFVDESIAGGLVTLGYGESKASYRLLITQIGGTLHPQFLKVLTADAVVTAVDVQGEQGFWVAGGPHVLLLLDERGADLEDTARLAANTLLYTRGDRTIRIEGDMTLDQALEIAATLD